ncbi:MAG TPA: hypothetical protein VEL80_08460 [Burkholderiales bacterium]|nr:hypothetical protein [Burkholderiales bacterium]
MYRKAREAEGARRRKLADDLKKRDQSSAPAKKPHTWLSRVIQPALAVLLLGLAAEGQAGLSGPALVGSVTIVQIANSTDATFMFAGQCRGNTANFSTTLSSFDVSGVTAANLEGLSLPGQGPAQCLSGGENLTVVTVVTPQFMNQNGVVNAGHVVILYVVP